MRRTPACPKLLLILAFACGGNGLRAAPPATGPTSTTAPAETLVTMEFPPDGIELTVLADIVSKRLHVPILYDETAHGKKVIIRVPQKVPEGALMGILQSALRMKQMALVDAEQPGWKQIVAAPNLANVAKPAAGEEAQGPVARVFFLQHADSTRLAEIIRPFLSTPGGSLQADAPRRVLIVADYATNVARADALVRQLDADAPPVEVRFVPLHQAEATAIAPAVTQLLNSRETAQWGAGASSGVSVSADERSNQLVVVAPPPRMAEVTALISGLDRPPEVDTKVYRLRSMSPERFEQLAKGMLGSASTKRGYQTVVDRESQSVVVSAPPDVLARLDRLLIQMDVPPHESDNPVQFYKLKNTKAADVLSTINSLLADETSTATSAAGEPTGGHEAGVGAERSSLNHSAGNAQSTMTGVERPMSGAGLGTPFTSVGTTSNVGSPSGVSVTGASNTQVVSPVLPTPERRGNEGAPGVLSVRNKNATVAADVNSNTIIVAAAPNVQQMYADLIRRLDERRPQVQIECTIVTLDTSDNFTFGVDISRLGGTDGSQLLTLSSFGVSVADPKTGQLTPVNAPGGTFALLGPNVANIVIRTLATNSRARFVSAPQLLVNDNGKGKLESVAQQPFAVILDASSTQSLTSLGGLASAGTSITVEPHISDADYLQLGYSIELSNFTGAAQNGLPPPSQKNAVDSSVTIPDNYTIVVGGLKTKSLSTDRSTIPFIGDIPLLGNLFGTQSKNGQEQTLFVFIHPVILRDEHFEDLKYLSGAKAKAAELHGDFPESKPLLMR